MADRRTKASWCSWWPSSAGGSDFAVDIMRIKEIIHPVPMTLMPQAPAFIEGVIELRGAILPVIDCASASTSRRRADARDEDTSSSRSTWPRAGQAADRRAGGRSRPRAAARGARARSSRRRRCCTSSRRARLSRPWSRTRRPHADGASTSIVCSGRASGRRWPGVTSESRGERPRAGRARERSRSARRSRRCSPTRATRCDAVGEGGAARRRSSGAPAALVLDVALPGVHAYELVEEAQAARVRRRAWCWWPRSTTAPATSGGRPRSMAPTTTSSSTTSPTRCCASWSGSSGRRRVPRRLPPAHIETPEGGDRRDARRGRGMAAPRRRRRRATPRRSSAPSGWRGSSSPTSRSTTATRCGGAEQHGHDRRARGAAAQRPRGGAPAVRSARAAQRCGATRDFIGEALRRAPLGAPRGARADAALSVAEARAALERGATRACAAARWRAGSISTRAGRAGARSPRARWAIRAGACARRRRRARCGAAARRPRRGRCWRRRSPSPRTSGRATPPSRRWSRSGDAALPALLASARASGPRIASSSPTRSASSATRARRGARRRLVDDDDERAHRRGRGARAPAARRRARTTTPSPRARSARRSTRSSPRAARSRGLFGSAVLDALARRGVPSAPSAWTFLRAGASLGASALRAVGVRRRCRSTPPAGPRRGRWPLAASVTSSARGARRRCWRSARLADGDDRSRSSRRRWPAPSRRCSRHARDAARRGAAARRCSSGRRRRGAGAGARRSRSARGGDAGADDDLARRRRRRWRRGARRSRDGCAPAVYALSPRRGRRRRIACRRARGARRRGAEAARRPRPGRARRGRRRARRWRRSARAGPPRRRSRTPRPTRGAPWRALATRHADEVRRAVTRGGGAPFCGARSAPAGGGRSTPLVARLADVPRAATGRGGGARGPGRARRPLAGDALGRGIEAALTSRSPTKSVDVRASAARALGAHRAGAATARSPPCASPRATRTSRCVARRPARSSPGSPRRRGHGLARVACAPLADGAGRAPAVPALEALAAPRRARRRRAPHRRARGADGETVKAAARALAARAAACPTRQARCAAALERALADARWDVRRQAVLALADSGAVRRCARAARTEQDPLVLRRSRRAIAGRAVIERDGFARRR